jgi:hypothetical protein
MWACCTFTRSFRSYWVLIFDNILASYLQYNDRLTENSLYPVGNTPLPDVSAIGALGGLAIQAYFDWVAMLNASMIYVSVIPSSKYGVVDW